MLSSLAQKDNTSLNSWFSCPKHWDLYDRTEIKQCDKKIKTMQDTFGTQFY